MVKRLINKNLVVFLSLQLLFSYETFSGTSTDKSDPPPSCQNNLDKWTSLYQHVIKTPVVPLKMIPQKTFLASKLYYYMKSKVDSTEIVIGQYFTMPQQTEILCVDFGSAQRHEMIFPTLFHPAIDKGTFWLFYLSMLPDRLFMWTNKSRMNSSVKGLTEYFSNSHYKMEFHSENIVQYFLLIQTQKKDESKLFEEYFLILYDLADG